MFQYYSKHYKSNLKLALPVVLAQAGQMVVSLVDNVMVGRVGTAPLAASSFANSIFIIILVFGIGFSYAITPMVGKAMGRRDEKTAVYWFRHGFWVNLLLSIGLVLVALIVALFMPWMGQPEEVVKLGIPYFLVIALSIVPFLFFASYKQFAEGLSNTRIAMVLTLFGNGVNIVFNYLFIYGKLGFPELGLLGAGVGTFIARLFMAIAFWWVYKRAKLFAPFRRIQREVKLSIQAGWQLFKLGGPIGVQFIVEVFAFSLGSIMMGWLGETSLAAHQIVITLASLTYMMSSGLAAATTIKVSVFRGENKFKELKLAAFASVHMVLLFMSITAIGFLLMRYWLPQLFVSDDAVIEIAAGLFLIAGFFQVFDGIQVIAMGILRGLEDVIVPMVAIAVAYLLIGIPSGYLLTFKVGLGPVGIWIGYLLGLFMVGLLLMLRFRKLYMNHEQDANEPAKS